VFASKASISKPFGWKVYDGGTYGSLKEVVGEYWSNTITHINPSSFILFFTAGNL